MFCLKNIFIFLLVVIFFFSCASNAYKKWDKAENYFYQGKYSSAVDEMRGLVKEAGTKDRLLYLMEAGVILHTQGEYEKSNNALKEADQIAETIKTSVSKEVLSFLLSDRQSNFKGESFERVLIKFYMALNYIMLGDYESAKRSFRKLDFDLKEMKYQDDKYKQNTAARFLDAILSESLGNYNDARVQYKNILGIEPKNENGLAGQFVLANKEKDNQDMRQYQQYQSLVKAYNQEMEKVNYKPNMGELIIIHQAGIAPAKRSRGRILDDQAFYIALRTAIQVAIVAQKAAISTATVIAMMGAAENPIPIYKPRDTQAARAVQVFVNSADMGVTQIMNDYTDTAIRNFNDGYAGLITKNVASIATKLVIAAVAANELSKKAEKATEGNAGASCLARFLIGAGTGGAVAATVKPDLRCWRLLPSNFQVKRIFLEPGEYVVTFNFFNDNVVTSDIPKKIVIQSGQPTFVNFRSMSPIK